MVNFNGYAQRLDSLVKKLFQEYQAAERKLKSANEYREYMKRSTDKLAVAEAEADYHRALSAKQNAFRALNSNRAKIAAIRKELSDEVSEAFAVNPEMVDTKALELLKSGIMGASDYARMYNKAVKEENPAMVRLVCKYAAETGEKNGNPELARIGSLGSSYTGENYLSRFDVMVNVYDRSISNPGLMDKWSELTAPLLDAE